MFQRFAIQGITDDKWITDQNLQYSLPGPAFFFCDLIVRCWRNWFWAVGSVWLQLQPPTLLLRSSLAQVGVRLSNRTAGVSTDHKYHKPIIAPPVSTLHHAPVNCQSFCPSFASRFSCGGMGGIGASAPTESSVERSWACPSPSVTTAFLWPSWHCHWYCHN